MVYNFSRDSEYHTQLNNKVIPAKTCNTTSMIMALKQAGHKPFFAPDDMQPEDYFTKFLINSQTCKERMRNRYSHYIKQNVPAYEIHEMLEWGINYLMTRDIDTFSTRVRIETIIEKLKQGCGIVLSGLFQLRNAAWGHIVSLAGFVTVNDEEPSIDNISGFIIDDPRGNFRSDYQDVRGNDIYISKAEFMEIFKDTESQSHKWAHVIERPKDSEGWYGSG